MRRRRARKASLRRAALAAAVFAPFAAADARAIEPAPCSAHAEFDRPDAVVGQQLLYRVRIERRHDVDSLAWLEPPAFPGFRAEWLPDVADPVDAGAQMRRFAERRALFPERAGELGATSARLSCRVGETEWVVEVAGVSLLVSAHPAGGRPDGFAGVVGPLAIERIVTPTRVQLGESIRVALMLRGEGNLWRADDPLGAIASADLFRRRPTTSFDAGRRLAVKHHFAYDVVPLEQGELVIPSLRVPYYDATTGRYATAGADALTVEVAPAAPAGATTAESASEAEPPLGPSAEAASARHTATKPRIGAVALLLVAALAIAAIAATRRRAARTQRAAIDAALDASARGDADATAGALRLALASQVDGAASRTPEELAADPALPEQAAPAVQRLVEAERARFDPTAEPPGPDAVRAAIERLR